MQTLSVVASVPIVGGIGTADGKGGKYLFKVLLPNFLLVKYDYNRR